MSYHPGPNPARPPKLCMSHEAGNPRLQLVGGPLDQTTVVVTPATAATAALSVPGGFYVLDGRVWSWCETLDHS